jgi:hypothetical protein
MKTSESYLKQFNQKKYKVYTWKNWMMLHWQINPGVAINELISGQRIPKVSLEDKLSDKPRTERGFVPCPHCEKLHNSKTWSKQNGTAFKNYFGLYCPDCGGIIPCLKNIFSILILTLTYPIWGWFKESLKRNWLEKQPQRFENLDLKVKQQTSIKKTWLKIGLKFGGMMFLLMSIGFPLLTGTEITLSSITFGLLIWTIAGLIFGFTMRIVLSQKGKNATA